MAETSVTDMFPALGPDAETPSTTTGAPRHLRLTPFSGSSRPAGMRVLAAVRDCPLAATKKTPGGHHRT
jgi:hypothetical protein